MLGKSITKNSLILGAFAILTAGILATTFLATAEKITEQEKRAARKALLEIVPNNRHDNNMLANVYKVTNEQAAELNVDPQTEIHVATQNGQPVAAIIPSVATDGYSGDIKLIIGVNIDGSIAGVRVLAHKETPGLGDKIELSKSSWVLDFNNASLTNPAPSQWTVKKDGGEFDQFTGATITPRAVVHQVKHTLLFFAKHKNSIFQSASIEKTPTLYEQDL